MLKILTYPDIDPQQWQALIDRSPYATWFQTKEAYEFYASNPEEMTPFAFGVVEDECKVEGVKLKGEENGKADTPASTLYTLHPTQNEASTPYTLHPTPTLKGVIVGYITKERSALKQFFTRRAIIIGGPLLAEDATAEEIAALLSAVKKLQRSDLQPAGRSTAKRSTGHSPIYIETRNFHDYSRWKEVFQNAGFAYQPHYDIHVHCNATHTMSERRQRELKRAVKNGAKIVEASSEQEIRDWYQILSQIYRQKVRTPLWSKAFFLHFYRSGVGKYLLVKYQDKVIGGMMCPILNGRAIYEWYVCGLDEEYRDLFPSVMATHAAIEYAKTNALPLFDFMGAGEPDIPYGVRDFKMEFGGELIEHGRFLCIRKPLLYWIGKMGVKWLKRRINKQQ